MPRQKTPKEIQREERWSHRVGVKEHQIKYLDSVKEKLKFKTRNGTLDYIINKYKKLDLNN